MKIYDRKVRNLTSPVYRTLKSLTLGNSGIMLPRLIHERYNVNGDSRAVWLCDENRLLKSNGDPRILSWGLLFKEPNTTSYNCYLYTHKRHRGQGYAKNIIHSSSLKYGNLTVFPWNYTLFEYFNTLHNTNFNITLDSQYM